MSTCKQSGPDGEFAGVTWLRQVASDYVSHNWNSWWSISEFRRVPALLPWPLKRRLWCSLLRRMHPSKRMGFVEAVESVLRPVSNLFFSLWNPKFPIWKRRLIQLHHQGRTELSA